MIMCGEGKKMDFLQSCNFWSYEVSLGFQSDHESANKPVFNVIPVTYISKAGTPLNVIKGSLEQPHGMNFWRP